MPFIDRSTLTYPATNSFPIRKWLDPARNPTTADFKNFQIFDIWINDLANTAWIMVDRTATSGIWLQMASSSTGILTITGNSGGAVGADGASNINIIGSGVVNVAGNAGTNTLTITASTSVPTTFTEDAGSATPAANNLNIFGGMGISTAGAGSTVTISAAGSVPLTFHTDGADATPALNAIKIAGAGGITTSGAGAVVTVTAGATIPTTFTADAGSATPAGNNLNILGSGSTTTSGAGSTITILSSGGGLSWNEITVVGPTALLVDNGYVTNSASQVQLLLPVTSPFGSVIEVVGKGSGGWIIQQNAAQAILELATTSTPGVTGTVQASEPGSTVRMVCITANTTWRIVASTGNLIFT